VRIGRLVRTGRLTRLARRLWMGSSPLRRRTDRIEAWITAGLLVAFLVGAPLLSVAAGRWVEHGGKLEQQAQQSWHRVPAVLLKNAPVHPTLYLRASWDASVLAPARWSGPGGRQVTGDVPVTPGSAAGRRLEVWVNRFGQPTGGPLPNSELVRRVVGAQVLAPFCLGAVLLCVGGLVRWLMDRRRLAAWGTGWASTGPRWTRHH
jgi:hypothetical protein